MNLKIKCFFSCIILLLISGKIVATEQSMDVMIYNDSISFIFAENLIKSPIRGYPLESAVELTTKVKNSLLLNIPFTPHRAFKKYPQIFEIQ